ncbi:MAG TPA: hypothetical protein VE998_12635 [Terriglobales bacterium]|nr:hypothetical protein [Terriglobales bacterium]
MMAATFSAHPIAHPAHFDAARGLPSARAVVNGVALAIPMWALIIWGIRALF